MPENNLLVVIDPVQKAQPALERAIQACQLSGGRLHLFECVNESYNELVSGSKQQKKSAIINEFHQQLDPLVDRVRLLGIEVSYELEWAEDWPQAIVNAAIRNESYIVFKSSYIHSASERSIKTSDWSLLRDCPCPVLLMHHHSNWENRRVLTAVNMAAQDHEHILLNKKIIKAASSLKDSFNASVHYVNAYSKNPDLEAGKDNIDDVFYDDLNSENSSKKATPMTVESLAEYCQSDAEHVHLTAGTTADILEAAADKLGVDLIVIGSVKRRGMLGRVLGLDFGLNFRRNRIFLS